ncbi:hypothetical protein J4418_03510 [Candidatus Woesearchaeota archaeon]|nr:hypothetical protein [Candidatus Woesearchaeota archaeon]
MIIGLTGYARAGKDFVADFLVQNYGFTKYVFSDILSEMLKELNLENSKENQSKLGVALRKVSTQHILATMLCEKLKYQENIAVSGFRSPGEVTLFRDTFGPDFSLIYINRTFENRFKFREELQLSESDFKKRDERDGKEMGLNGLIDNKLYDHIIENNDTDFLLFQKLSEYIGQIKTKRETRLAHEGRKIVKNNCDFINWVDSFQRENGFDRHKKEHFYLVQAWANTRIATCLRRRHGAVLVSQKDIIIGSGYNGAQRGIIDSLERKMCFRDTLEIPPGTRYEACISSHAEENAIDFTYDRHGLEGATIYIVGVDKNGDIYDTLPCINCAKKIVQIGIKRIVCATRPETDKNLFRVLTRQDLINKLETGEYFSEDVKQHPEFKKYQDNVHNIRNTWEKYKKKE